MSWDPERYREKRQRVLAGNGKQGSGFVKVLLGAVLAVFALGLALGAPAAWSRFSMRHLDDVILRVDGVAHAATLLHEGEGIRQVREDHGGNRLVVTFDRRVTSAKSIVERLKVSGADCFLLNTMPHSVGERQRKEMAHEAG